ncbi:MAG: hypothetical protein GX287_01620 [Fusobacteria bacterium]|nr:hypothetical protein [Fusobacteriota bacterium]
MNSVKSLFMVLFVVLVFHFIGLYNNNDKLAFLLIAVVLGWGLDYLLSFIFSKLKEKTSNKVLNKSKVLDSSVIIDGRILDIIDADFVEGDVIIPRFVLDELQYLADSDESMKRAKGKRGLDLIKLLQNAKKNKVIISEKDYEAKEVDSKLVSMAKDFGADLVTTDFNLNKVATIQGIRVLNINKLSNALKPMVIPNEELDIELIKSGDREGQAVGYLNDGTMVVAEDGGDCVGKKVVILVTSVYPTAAGRMIFGRIKSK